MILHNKFQFSATPLALLRDKELSPQAIGLGAWLFSHNDKFAVKKSKIHTFFKCGPDAIRSAWKELVSRGYIVEKGRQRNDTGQLGEYVYDLNPFGMSDKPYVGKSNVGETNIGSANIGEPEVISTTSKDTSSNSTSSKRERGARSKRFVEPNTGQVSGYMQSKGLSKYQADREAEKFVNHFESNGWKIGGKAPMKSWEAAVRNWIGRMSDFGKSPNGSEAKTPHSIPIPQWDGNKYEFTHGSTIYYGDRNMARWVKTVKQDDGDMKSVTVRPEDDRVLSRVLEAHKPQQQ